LGRNILNPAATAKCLFLILTGFVMKEVPRGYGEAWREGSLSELFFGVGDGMIGEVSVFLLLLGGVYLMFCKVISPCIPVMYLMIFVVMLAVFGAHGDDWGRLVKQLCNGELMLGAFFLANDYTTSPMTKTGKLIFGVIVGGLTGVVYVLGYTAEAVAFSVLCGNLLVPLIEKLTFPKFFGKGKKANI